jgi:hypothetical protein
MSTLLQLINEILRRTGQIEVSTLTNAPIPVTQTRDFLNEIYVEMLQRIKADRLIKRASFSTVNGTSNYNLATDAEVNSLIGDSVIETSSQQRLREVDYTYPLSQGTTASSKPTCFYRADNQIYLYPTPNASYTLQYQYFIKPSLLVNDTDIPQLPVEWEKVLILGTQARLENFLGESGEETYLLYRDGLAQLKSRSRPKSKTRMKGYYRGNA